MKTRRHELQSKQNGSLSKFKKLLHQRGTLFVLAFALVGSALLLATHAATPTASLEPELGSKAGVGTLADATASGGSYVQFGSSGGSGGLTPMQLLNRRADVKVYPASAAAASDSSYQTSWNPGSTGTISFDVSAVPAANRSKLVLAWYTALEDGYSSPPFMQGDCGNYQRPIPTNYTIEVNAAAGGGTSAPTSGWVNAATVAGNIYYSRQKLVDMINPSTQTPYNWIRMNVTASVSDTGNWFDVNVDLADASQGVTSDWLMIGDSITAIYAGHNMVNGSGETMGPGIADLVATAMGSSYHLITQNTGAPCSKAPDWNSVYSSFSPNPTIDDQLALFPGKYVTFNLGTNDSWGGGGDPNAYYSTMQTIVQKIIATGKTPVIPHIPWPNNGDNTTWDNGVKAYNAKIDQLYAAFPQIVKGPDLYKVMQDHTTWFGGAGNVHPNGTGATAMRCAWAYAIAENVYGTTPAPISTCNGFASP